MSDHRRPPFCFQECEAMRLLRRRFQGRERTVAVAVYQALTEVANEERGRETGFAACRGRIAEYAGVTKRTLDRYAEELEALGLLAITRRSIAGAHLPNMWHLLSPAARVAQQEALPGAAESTRGGAAADTPIQEEHQEEQHGDDVADVWAHWCEHRKPRRTDLEPSQAKLIRRALNADFTVDELKRGINGLLKSDWHRENRKLHLSSLLATRPGGPTLRDQVESFIELAERSSTASGARNARSGGEGVSSEAVARAKGEVLRAWEMPHSTQAHEQAQEALEVLDRHGIDVVKPDDGRPTFEVRR